MIWRRRDEGGGGEWNVEEKQGNRLLAEEKNKIP